MKQEKKLCQICNFKFLMSLESRNEVNVIKILLTGK